MPKETIQTERIGHIDVSVHADTNCACANEIVISWGRGSGAAMIGVAQQNATPGDVTMSHYADIDPEAIERMVKILRRAKRQLA